MNIILSNKLAELEKANDYECWYLVKQPTAFDSLCYLVSFLKEYQEKTLSENLQTFVGIKISELNRVKPHVEISNNYRALRVAAFFGLIRMTTSKYDEAVITETFSEITERCNGDYEQTELYMDIIKRQIEKMFISSPIDEEYQGVRQAYRLYPVMLLYKVLLELGRATGEYSIGMTEYRYLVATTKTFEGFLETLLLIKLFREDKQNASAKFEEYRSKFDNRLIQALKQLDTLEVGRDYIRLKDDKIDEVAHKVFAFEQNPNVFTTENYLDFLGSAKTLLELEPSEQSEEEKATSIENSFLTSGCNRLFYGVPGSGKSHSVDGITAGKPSKRVVFHPDYTNSDFIGQILPGLDENDKLEYRFTPGPFTDILLAALLTPTVHHYLIIEEINRGNAPAIFGEVFQLLDRDEKGQSKYGVINNEVLKYLNGKLKEKGIAQIEDIKIPGNLSILATMNTSDQNVFTIDTAFQRRWNMKYVKNNFDANVDADEKIAGSQITWKVFGETVNNVLADVFTGIGSAEDKGLGAFFAKKEEIIDAEKFGEKVLKYLWDDAFKMDREKFFNIGDGHKKLQHFLEEFEKPTVEDGTPVDSLKLVVKPEVFEKMCGK